MTTNDEEDLLSAGADEALSESLDQSLTYAPLAYGPRDSAALGRWALIEPNIIVWTDDKEGAGVTWLTQTALASELLQHFQLAKSTGLTTTVAYELAITRAGDALKERFTGRLEDMEDLRVELMDLV